MISESSELLELRSSPVWLFTCEEELINLRNITRIYIIDYSHGRSKASRDEEAGVWATVSNGGSVLVYAGDFESATEIMGVLREELSPLDLPLQLALKTTLGTTIS